MPFKNKGNQQICTTHLAKSAVIGSCKTTSNHACTLKTLTNNSYNLHISNISNFTIISDTLVTMDITFYFTNSYTLPFNIVPFNLSYYNNNNYTPLGYSKPSIRLSSSSVTGGTSLTFQNVKFTINANNNLSSYSSIYLGSNDFGFLSNLYKIDL